MKKLILFINEYQKKYKNKAKLFYKKGLFSESPTSGYVLIMVLVMSTLLISVTSEFIAESHTSISYMRKFDAMAQAEYLAKSGVRVAVFILNAESSGIASALTGRQGDSNVDSFESLWAMDFPEIPTEMGTIRIEIEDENAKINLNAFANQFTSMTPYYYAAQLFFLNMGLSPDLVDAIHDWVDPNAGSSSYYARLDPPYSAKNGPMDSIDELLMIRGFTPEIFYGLDTAHRIRETNLVENNRGKSEFTLGSFLDLEDDQDIRERNIETRQIGKESSRKLSDYFRVHGNSDDFLHVHNRININTASFRVISALTERISDYTVTEIIDRRMDNPFKSVNEIKDLFPNEDDFETFSRYLTTKSYIFRITVTATVDDHSVKVITYFNREQRRFLYWSEE